MTKSQFLDALYIHFPYCRHLCNYCDFYKVRSDAKSGQNELSSFHQYLEQSYLRFNELMQANHAQWAPLDTLYLGGGTPSLWGKDGFIFLNNFLKSKGIRLAADAEVTLEVNPGGWDLATIEAFEQIGGNRFSVGVQSLDPRFMKWLDRVHSLEDTLDTLNFFAKAQANFSVDFMLGLPYSEEANRDILAELKTVMSYKPQHISLYILTVGSGYQYKDKLPSEEWIEREYLQVSSFLSDHGFEHYEVSNFAQASKRSRHNIKYWYNQSVAALGPSATGFFEYSKLRYKWKVNEPDVVLEPLNQEQLKLEKLYLALRLSDGIKISDFFAPIDRLSYLELVAKWAEMGYIRYRDEDRVILSPQGFLMMDSLLDQMFSLYKDL